MYSHEKPLIFHRDFIRNGSFNVYGTLHKQRKMNFSFSFVCDENVDAISGVENYFQRKRSIIVRICTGRFCHTYLGLFG